MDAHVMVALVMAIAVAVPALWVLHKVAKALVWIVEALAALVVLVLGLVLLVKYLGKLVWSVITHPRSALTFLLGLCCWHWLGWLPIAAAAGALGLAALIWHLAAPMTFDRWVGRRARAWWLRWMLYHPRLPRWCARLGLVVIEPQITKRAGLRPRRAGAIGLASLLMGRVGAGGGQQVKKIAPRVIGVRSGASWDQVRVKLPATAIPEDWAKLTRHLATARKVERCAVHEVRPGVISVDFLRRDLLAQVRYPDWDAILRVPVEQIDLRRVECGRTEYGLPLYEDLRTKSAVYGGVTGSGKASAMWSPHVRIAPAIGAGLVVLNGLDPKGVELAYARGVFDHYVRTATDAAAFLTWVVDELIPQRIAMIEGEAREVEISTDCPLHVIEFDEVSHWCRYLTDTKLRNRIVDLCKVIITQGRALGIVLRCYAQSPLKDDVPFRDLAPRRTALRCATASHVDAALGEGAIDRGAWAHRIATDKEGQGYREGEGLWEPERIRYDFPTDELLKTFETYVVIARAERQMAIAGATP